MRTQRLIPGAALAAASRVSAAAAAALMLGTSAFAAVPVVESRASGDPAQPDQRPGVAAQPTTPAPASAVPGAGADSGASLARLYYQLQTMQEELRQLRGQLEEQQFVIERLRRDQQEQYLDLDGRLADLARRGAVAGEPSEVPAQQVAATAAQTGARTPSLEQPAATSAPRTSASASEQQAYNGAISQMRDKRFDESVDSFNRLVVEFPNGALTPNAFYWLGELYLAKNELEQSRQSFMQVLNLYPDHRKVPDSLYKLGVVYSMQGDSRRSLEYLKRVQEDYPDSSAAGLAGTFAAELQ